MSTHFPERPLRMPAKFGKQETFAVWSRRPAKKAILFVHGYSGAALTTWSEFHHLLPDTPGLEGHDLIFFGYDGLFSTTAASATLFYQFLDHLFRKPARVINPSLPARAARPDNFAYDHITLAAHSLGAVLTRWALLFAHQNKRPWVAKTSMVLYAPAHMGARIERLAMEVSAGGGSLGNLLRVIGVVSKFKSPLIEELKEGSAELQALLDQTKVALEEGAAPYLVAKRVVIADRETVVKNLRFADDPWPPETYAATSHTSVCKPRRDFSHPLDVLRTAL